MNKKKNSALVVEGGGMRGVFSAGVLNAFGTTGFDPFDLYIGVSAGACNLAAHLAEQHNRNYHVTTAYSATSRFINLLRFIRGGHYMDLDWLWDITIRNAGLTLTGFSADLKRVKRSMLWLPLLLLRFTFISCAG
jgi:predicted patatin/cPLA2 family phospholipase